MKAAPVLTETGYIYPFWNIDVSQHNTWIKTRPKVVYLRSLECTCEEKEEKKKKRPRNEESEDLRREAIVEQSIVPIIIGYVPPAVIKNRSTSEIFW